MVTLQRPGQNNATGDVLANFKVRFSGLIAHKYDAGLKFAATIVNRAYPKGNKALELKYHDDSDPVYFNPGDDLWDTSGYAENPQRGSKKVALGKRLVKAGALDDLDALMEDFDSQKEHAKAIRRGLQRKDDTLCMRAVIAAAARNGGANEYTNEPDLDSLGTTTNGILTLDFTTGSPDDIQKADLLKDAIYAAKSNFDVADVPDEGRTFAIRPEHYGLLFHTTDKEWLNKDFADNPGGGTSSGKVLFAAGFRIIRSTNIPNTDLSAEGSNQAELDRNFVGTLGAFYTEEAAVRSVPMGVNYKAWYHEDKLANVYRAWMAAAYGSYRRECAQWIKFV